MYGYHKLEYFSLVTCIIFSVYHPIIIAFYFQVSPFTWYTGYVGFWVRYL